ncbi:MAG: hypothetical protein C5S38_02595 [Candidatus Methanophagaceae archaeon]|jgi:hypothetical protein|nr:MAG: hypothetical protein C5S38_02595 [Methanophagales archaeon]
MIEKFQLKGDISEPRCKIFNAKRENSLGGALDDGKIRNR